MTGLSKVMEREMLHSEHAQCFIEARRRRNARKKNPKCPKCGCNGVLNSANMDDGKASSWTCWDWQCRHVWKTPNVEGNRLAAHEPKQE